MSIASEVKIDVRPMSGWMGAEIFGVDLTQPLAPETVKEIRDTWLQWKVIFFRDQILNHEQHIRLASYFGKPTPAHPLFDAIPEHPEIFPVFRHRSAAIRKGAKGAADDWHTDVTAAVNPPTGAILRSMEVVPPYGGDTQFTNCVAAFDDLSESMQGYVSTLRARHSFTMHPNATEDYIERWNKRPLVSEHPVVRVHPETGERALYVNPGFTKEIVDVTPRESQKILELLYQQISRPRFTCRFRWAPGSIAFWDNRCTAHMGPTDFEHLPFDRDFYRVTIEGEIPVGVDGRPSEAIEGDPFLAAVAVAKN